MDGETSFKIKSRSYFYIIIQDKNGKFEQFL